MPTDTFFRLPEEKRSRILGSAWNEFTRVPYSAVSINSIIQHACIPRGSFYQYFEDKSDLFFYLMEQTRDQFIALFQKELTRTHGDLFAMFSGVFDVLFQSNGEVAEEFGRIFKLFQLNASMDVPRLFFERTKDRASPLDAIADRIDTGLLRCQEREYMEDVFSLLASAIGCAIARTLQDPANYVHERTHLWNHIEIVKNGSAAVPEGGYRK